MSFVGVVGGKEGEEDHLSVIHLIEYRQTEPREGIFRSEKEWEPLGEALLCPSN